MGQGGSKQHSPLTFGYVDHSRTSYHKKKIDVNTSSEDGDNNTLADYVLNHPELYKLEAMCMCARNPITSNYQTVASSNNDCTDESIVTSQQQDCCTCQQNNRLPFVCHLAKDLEYIDETYYADINHYEYAPNSNGNSILGRNRLPLESTTTSLDNFDYIPGGNDDDDDHIDDNWGKVTVGGIMSQTASHSMIPPATNDLHDGDATAFTAQSATLTLDLSGRNLIKLSSGIGYLSNLTKLNLSNNQLSTLPKSIGYLSNLTVLNTAHNQLETLPDTMVHLTKLKAMNICHNNITHLPPCLGFLPELIIIIANNNQIRWIPNEIANLQQMISFNISNNPLSCLPAEVANIKSLRKLIAEGCDFQTEFINKRQHDPPTLFEQCARTIVQHQLTLPNQLPGHIRDYLSTHQACSHCHGPYFESFVTRGRFIERVTRQPIALEYRLCRAHWSDEQDRLLHLFSTSPSVTDQPVYSPGGDMTDEPNICLPTLSTTGPLQRSGSNSSSISSSYRILPTLPLLPGLNGCKNNESSPCPTTMSIDQEEQLESQQQQQLINLPRTNSFTKRFTRLLSPSRNIDSNDSNSSLVRATRSHSSLRQEITPANTSTTSKEDSIQNSAYSPDDKQHIYPCQHDVQLQHTASSSFRPNDSNHHGDIEQQPPIHGVKAGTSPSSDITHPGVQ